MIVVIFYVAYLAGDDTVFDAFIDVFSSELAQIRGEGCFITCVNTEELEVKIYFFTAHLIDFFHNGFCWSCSDGGCRI